MTVLQRLAPGLAAAILITDLAQPGYLQFVDLPFVLRARWSQVRFEPSPSLALGQDCRALTQHPQLLQTSVVLSQQLLGQSEQDLLTQLGPPACRLTDSVYQWLLDNGMTLQAQLEGGKVKNAQVSDPAIP